MADPLEWVPRIVYVRLAARRFFDDHGSLGIEHVNEMPRMGDGAHETSLRVIPDLPSYRIEWTGGDGMLEAPRPILVER